MSEDTAVDAGERGGGGGETDATERIVDAPRGDRERAWETFVRPTEGDPLRHVGSVSAPSAAVAREQATALFDDEAVAIWCCPADETVRWQDASLGVGRAATDETGASSVPDGEQS